MPVAFIFPFIFRFQAYSSPFLLLTPLRSSSSSTWLVNSPSSSLSSSDFCDALSASSSLSPLEASAISQSFPPAVPSTLSSAASFEADWRSSGVGGKYSLLGSVYVLFDELKQHPLNNLLVNHQILRHKAAENYRHIFMLLQKLPDNPQGNMRRLEVIIAINSSGNAGEGNCLELIRDQNLKRLQIRGRKEPRSGLAGDLTTIGTDLRVGRELAGGQTSRS